MINVSVSGNLGQDAELKTVGENSVLSFGVASNAKIKGEKVTTWVRCDIWGTRAEALAEYLKKGTKVVVVGTLNVRTYEVEGETRTSLDVRVDQLDFMSSGERETGEVGDDEFPHGANEPAKKSGGKPAAKPAFKSKGTNGSRHARS